MSLKKTTFENCPHCNSNQEISFYSSVNITVNPELKQRVLTQKLNSQICTNCKKEINVVTGFLYHDMQNQLMINFVVDPKDNDSLDFSEVLKGELKKYTFKEINDYFELVELIKICDQKLNYKVIYKVKEDLKTMLEQASPDFTFNIYFKNLEKGLFKKQLVYQFFSHPSQIMELKYNFKNMAKEDLNNLFNLDVLRN